MDFPEGTFTIGGDLKVRRLGFGAMRITGRGIWGPPANEDEAIRVLRRAVELGVNLIDTADSYGPEVSERIIAKALHPYPVRPRDCDQRRTCCGPVRVNGVPIASPRISRKRARAV